MRLQAKTKVTDSERQHWRETIKRSEKDFIRHDLTYKVAEELFRQEGLLNHEDFNEKPFDFYTQYDIEFFILRPSTLLEILEVLKTKYNIQPEDWDLAWEKMYQRL